MPRSRSLPPRTPALRPALLLLALLVLPACRAAGAQAPRPLALKTIHAPAGDCGHAPR